MSTLQKRAISIFLCLLMIVGATVVAVPVGAVETYTWTNSETYAPSAFNDVRVIPTADKTVAYRFETLIPFKNLKIQINEFAGTVSVTLKLYEWKGTYDASVGSTVIAENTYTANGTVAIGDTTSEHPAGGYLIVCTTTAVGTADSMAKIVANKDHAFLYGSTYIDGVQQPTVNDWRIQFAVPDGYNVDEKTDNARLAAIFKTVLEEYTWNENKEYAPSTSTGITSNPKNFTDSIPLAYRFNALIPFKNPHVQLQSTNSPSATLTLYKWNGSYAATVSESNKIAENTYTLSASGYYDIGDASIVRAAGEYLVVITTTANGTDATATCLAGALTNDADPGYFYINGAEQSKGLDMRLQFFVPNSITASEGTTVTDATQVFGPCKSEWLYSAGTSYAPGQDYSALDPVEVTVGHSMGYRFNLALGVTNMKVQTVSMNAGEASATLKLYAWKTDYKTTVAGEAIQTANITGKNNAIQTVFEENIAAGEYLIVATTEADGINARFGLQGRNKQTRDGVEAFGYYYVDGVEQVKDFDLRIQFIVSEHTNNPFATCGSSASVNSIEYAGFQVSADMSGNTFNIRFVATIDNLNFKQVGFEVEVTTSDGTRKWIRPTTKVYKSLNAEDSKGNAYQVEAPEGTLFVALAITDIPTDLVKDGNSLTFQITPYVVDFDGAKTDAAARTVTYPNA